MTGTIFGMAKLPQNKMGYKTWRGVDNMRSAWYGTFGKEKNSRRRLRSTWPSTLKAIYNTSR